MSLWQILTAEEKIDLFLHQRIEVEAQIMTFLIMEEFGVQRGENKSIKMNQYLERSLDQQIFKKYINSTRLQAIYHSINYCVDRLNLVRDEDKKHLEYIAFLKDKYSRYKEQCAETKR